MYGCIAPLLQPSTFFLSNLSKGIHSPGINEEIYLEWFLFIDQYSTASVEIYLSFIPTRHYQKYSL